MFKAKIAATALIVTLLSACGPAPQVPQMPQMENPMQQAPMPQAQQADDGIGLGTVAAAAIGGAVLGNMAGKSSSQPQRTVIIDNRSRDYGYRNNGYSKGYGYGYGKKTTTTTTTTKRSMFGGKTTTTRTVTKRRR